MSKKVLAKFTPPSKKKSSESEEPKKAKKSKKDKSSKKKAKKSKDKVATKKAKSDKPKKKVKKESDESSEVESAHLHIRIAPSLLKTLQKAATKEDRKYANLAKVILREGLKKRGFNV